MPSVPVPDIRLSCRLFFFFAVKTLEGLPHKLPEVLREQYLKTVLVGYLLWPLAHIINFKFIPTDPTDSVCQLVRLFLPRHFSPVTV